MKISNPLWAVVERSNNGCAHVFTGEIFYTRKDARNYLTNLKTIGVKSPRNLFIRQLRVTNNRG